VLKFSLGRDGASGAVTLVALLPLGLDFAAGVSGAVDDKPAFKYGLRTCIGTTCVAVVAVSAEGLADLKSGTQLRIGFKMLTESEPRVLAGSLNGITAGAAAAGL
jgi:invasion protein IalB